jgi:PAS domain-containing protein
MQHSASEPTTQQINDIFDSAELASAVDFDEFKKFLDHAPIAIIVSKLLQGEQRIAYANKAFEVLTGRVFAEIRGRGWSILDTFRGEDDTQVTLGHALLTDEDYIGTFKLEMPKSVLVEVYAGVIQDEDGGEKYRIAGLLMSPTASALSVKNLPAKSATRISCSKRFSIV